MINMTILTLIIYLTTLILVYFNKTLRQKFLAISIISTTNLIITYYILKVEKVQIIFDNLEACRVAIDNKLLIFVVLFIFVLPILLGFVLNLATRFMLNFDLWYILIIFINICNKQQLLVLKDYPIVHILSTAFIAVCGIILIKCYYNQPFSLSDLFIWFIKNITILACIKYFFVETTIYILCWLPVLFELTFDIRQLVNMKNPMILYADNPNATGRSGQGAGSINSAGPSNHIVPNNPAPILDVSSPWYGFAGTHNNIWWSRADWNSLQDRLHQASDTAWRRHRRSITLWEGFLLINAQPYERNMLWYYFNHEYLIYSNFEFHNKVIYGRFTNVFPPMRRKMPSDFLPRVWPNNE